METRTVWQMVWDDYQKWFSNAMIGFGAFNLNRKSNRGATRGLCRIVNFIIAVIGTPWIIAHWVAFCNKNVRPQRTCNKVGYWIATIVSLLLDTAFIGASVFIMWFVDTHPQGALLGFIDIVFFAIPLFWVGIKKIPYLFVKAPFDRKLHTASTEEFKPYWETSKPDPHIQYVNYDYNSHRIIDATTGDTGVDEDERIDIDEMDGGTFEHFCADLLRVNGWTDVRVTPASGDHGIDITAEKDDIKWGFQCKRWGDTKVDAIAIGQTYKGKALYECDMVAVITTSTLTAQAEGEAKQLGIKVWGRGKIRQLMSNLDNADDYYLSA